MLTELGGREGPQACTPGDYHPTPLSIILQLHKGKFSDGLTWFHFVSYCRLSDGCAMVSPAGAWCQRRAWSWARWDKIGKEAGSQMTWTSIPKRNRASKPMRSALSQYLHKPFRKRIFLGLGWYTPLDLGHYDAIFNTSERPNRNSTLIRELFLVFLLSLHIFWTCGPPDYSQSRTANSGIVRILLSLPKIINYISYS